MDVNNVNIIENAINRMPGIAPEVTRTEFIPEFDPNLLTHREVGEAGHGAFESFFQAALDLVNETNYLQVRSDIAQMEFATGQETNMLTVILAQERANSSLNFTVQVTNRIVEAYREIMRMQS